MELSGMIRIFKIRYRNEEESYKIKIGEYDPGQRETISVVAGLIADAMINHGAKNLPVVFSAPCDFEIKEGYNARRCFSLNEKKIQEFVKEFYIAYEAMEASKKQWEKLDKALNKKID